MTHQNQFENHQELISCYGSSSLRNNNNAAYPHETLTYPNIESIGDRIISRTVNLVQGSESEMSHTRHLMDLLGAANENNHQQQGLSLSLNSHMFVDEYNRHRSLNQALINPSYFMSQPQETTRDETCNHQPVENLTSDYFFSGGNFPSSSNNNNSILNNRSPSTSYGPESFAAIIGNSRYLKPVQSLLEDLVDVGGNVIDRMNEKYAEKLFHGSRTGARTLSSELKAELRNNGHLLADKHEHQIKIAKLIALLDEVGLLFLIY